MYYNDIDNNRWPSIRVTNILSVRISHLRGYIGISNRRNHINSVINIFYLCTTNNLHWLWGIYLDWMDSQMIDNNLIKYIQYSFIEFKYNIITCEILIYFVLFNILQVTGGPLYYFVFGYECWPQSFSKVLPPHEFLKYPIIPYQVIHQV